MKLRLIDGKGIILVPILFILFTFFVPISPTLKSIFFGCSISAILLTPYYSKHLFDAFNSLWGRAALVFLGFIVIASIWSPASYAMRLMVVGKYCKLLYLPIIAVGFIRPGTRNMAINSYLAAMLLTCVISILKSHNLFTPGDPGEVFYNHIITGFMMAFACYLAALYAFKYQGKLRIVYSVIALLMSYQVLFINTGRTGYVIYFMLTALLLLDKLNLKKAILSILIFSGVFGCIYYESPIMQDRVQELVSDIKYLQENNQNTSLGYRIQFHNYAKSLMEKHPLTGIGTGGFKYSFAQDNPIPSWGLVLTDPHSQYWMTLSEQGIIGMVLLCFFLTSLFITSFQLTETRPILLGILFSFCIGSLSDTILCYSTAGYLLIVMSAICFGELLEKRAFKNVNEAAGVDDSGSIVLQA